MRLEKYINRIDETTDEELLNYFLSEVKDYLKEQNGVRLWRATNKNIKGIQKFSARSDRHPRDTPKEVHEWLDKWFKSNFGWKARSQGVFCASTPSGIEMFGKNVNLFFPCNGYKYIYSNTIHDLTAWLEDNGYIEEMSNGKWEATGFNHEGMRMSLMKRLKQEYTDKKLPDASWANTEVMMHCPNGYYQIDGAFFKKFHMEIYPN